MFQIAAVPKSFTIQSLPVDILVIILSYFSFHEVATIRLVSKSFNQASKEYLTSGYKKGRQLLKETRKAVEAKLPIRQALRDQHPLKDSVTLLIMINYNFK